MSKPVPVLCIYRPRKGTEDEFLSLVEKHWPTLEKASLVTGEPARVWRGSSRGGATVFIELYTWKDADAVQAAHHTPELMKVWEPMGALCEGNMEFIDVDELAMPYTR